MKGYKSSLISGAIAVLVIVLTSCEKDPNNSSDKTYELPNFKNVTENLIKDNLEFPSGLSANSSLKKYELKITKGTAVEVYGVFIEAPLYVNLHSLGGIQPYKNPTISEFSGDLANVSIAPLSDIDLNTYFSDFDSPSYYALADSLSRAKGITLDGLVLNDGAILASSNSSDKLFKVNDLGNIEIFLQDKELERITDMIQGSDGKIYAAQAPLIDDNNSSIFVYPKRVISIENGVIKTEFELPLIINTYVWSNPYQPEPYWWRAAPILEKIKVIENSENGKTQFGAEFYACDLLEDVIYKIDKEMKVSELARGLNFPSSIAVDSIGNLYYTTSPLSLGTNDLIHKVSLNILNPETGESNLLHEFNETVDDYRDAGSWVYLKYNGKYYNMRVGFNVTNVLYESKDKLEFLITNSLQGTLKSVTLEK